MIKRYIEYIKDNPEGYWFRAKIFGWGWTPATWQGWMVTLVFVLLIVGNIFRLDLASRPENEVPWDFFVQTGVLIFVLLFICYKKGEKPRWQWGIPGRKKEDQH